MRTLLLLAAWTMVAEAAPSYPVKIKTVSQAERDHRRAAFEAREPLRWTEVVVNSRGLIVHLATEDLPATLNAVDLDPVRELLRREAGAFGIDAADVDGEFHSRGSCAHQLIHERNGATLGRIDIRCRATGDRVTVLIDVVPWLDVTPKLVADDATKRVLGGRYAITSTERLRPMLDCNMGGRGCPKPRVVTRHDVVTFTEQDLVGVESAVYRNRNTLRLVYCVESTWNGPTVRALGTAKRLPYVVDAVTGAALPVHPATCAAIPSID